MRVADRTETGLVMDATFNGVAFGLDHMTGYSITANVLRATGTLAGALTLEASNDAFLDNVNNNPNPNATWVLITGSSQAVSLSSGSGAFMWNTEGAYYRAFRLVWTRTGGTGTASVVIHAKGPNT